MAIEAVTLSQPAVLVLLVRPFTMQVPFVEVFRICWNIACNFADGIAVATATTEENAVVG